MRHLFTCALMLLSLLPTKYKSRNNGDEGNRTLISAMRPRRAPVTPRPLNCPFDAILHDCFHNSKTFLSPVALKKLELPLLIAENLFYPLTLWLFLIVSRITNSHQLNYSYIVRNAQYWSYFFRIERANPARCQS